MNTWVHGEIMASPPVHGGKIPVHGGLGPPVHGSNNRDTVLAPVLTPTSVAGDPHPAWDSYYENASVDETTLRMQWRINGGAWNTDTDQLFTSDIDLGGAINWPLFGAVIFSNGDVVDVREYQILAGVSSPPSNISTFNIVVPSGPATEWNATGKSSFIAISGAENQIATGTLNLGGYASVRGTPGKSSGKHYFEVLLDDTNDSNYIGVEDGSHSLTDFTDAIWASASVVDDVGEAFTAGAYYSNPIAAFGDVVIGIAVDLDANLIWFAKNNTFGGNPSAGTGGIPCGLATAYPIFAARSNSIATLHTVVADCAYAPPTGFAYWG